MPNAARGNPPSIKLDGSAQERLNSRLLSMLVEETHDGIYRCEVTFQNWQPASEDYLFFDRQLLDFGKEITVQPGDYDGAPTLFTGKITAIEGRFPQSQPPEITVLAEDGLQDLRMTRRTRTFAKMSDSQIISQVAGDHFGSTSVNVTGPTHDFIVQFNQSDLAFVRERARAVDAEVWIDAGKFTAQSRADRNGGDLTLVYGDTLLEFSALADLAGQRTKVVVTGWDVTNKQAIKSEVTSSVVQKELASLTGGDSVLQSAFGERVEQLVHTVPVTDDEAKAYAEATYRRLARRFVTGSGVAIGDARLRVGVHVQLEGLGDLYSGAYFVSEVRHTYTGEIGYRTQFRVERAGIGG